jgi:hypothetical protein
VAEAHGAVVYIHPAGNASPRFEKWYLWNSIGQAFEETMATASLFYEGILGFFTTGADTPNAVRAYVRTQHDLWGQLTRDIGLQPE